MYTDLTILKMKITKKQSISAELSKIIEAISCEKHNGDEFMKYKQSSYLQGPSLTTESMLKFVFHYCITSHYRKRRQGRRKEKSQPFSWQAHTVMASFWHSSFQLFFLIAVLFYFTKL